MTKTTKKQQMLNEIRKAERIRILWEIHHMIMDGNLPSDGILALQKLHKHILDTSK